jgi:gluconolactonase
MANVLGKSRIRAALLAAAVATGIVAGVPAAQADSESCGAGWQVSTVVGGVGNLENLDTDGAGGFYLTGIVDGYLAHIDAAGKFETLVTGLEHPAGVRVDGPYVYFLTGDGFDSAPGTLRRYDIAAGTVTTLLSDLNGPNGLLLLPGGDLLFAVMGAHSTETGISRYRPSTGAYTKIWSPLPFPNGLALAADGKSIYADNLTLRIFRIPLDNPDQPVVVAGAPDVITLPDDMEATRAGSLFVADHIAGAVYQIDTATGAACTIITGLIKPGPVRNPPDGATSVRIARDGSGWALFVTSMDGTLRRMRPPADVDLAPADSRR